jgi:hypothetical protein
MLVVAVVVAADLIRSDSGLVAAVVLGMLVANQRSIDVSLSLFEFEETLVQLLIGLLFVLVAASVSPHEVRSVMPEAIGLLAAMVVLVRPAAVALTLARSPFTRQQKTFVAWMAPRGIVAGATASAFGPDLAAKGVVGANKVLPIVFVAIFGTVVVYGLTAAPLARLLGVAGAGRTLVLIVGGHPWAREFAAALRRCGVAVRMWVGPLADQAAARTAGVEADRGRIMVDAIDREAELEEVTDALLLTRSDDFNMLCAAELRDELGHRHVFRIAPHPDQPDILPPARESGILGNRSLTFAELDRIFAAGARVGIRDPSAVAPRAHRAEVPLFAVTPEGRVNVGADGRPPRLGPSDTVIVLTPPEPQPASERRSDRESVDP